jgi:hypothetical protein
MHMGADCAAPGFFYSCLDMFTRDKLLCFLYGLTGLAALPATWIHNRAFMQQVGHNSVGDFFQSAYANPAAASLANDLAFLAVAACVFMAIEGPRVGVRYWWAYIVLSGLTAISVTFPLFLLARQLKLSQVGDQLAAGGGS